MGKLGYVAPEQAAIEKTWDHRVDLFAAGIILYELLTKQKPFPQARRTSSRSCRRARRRSSRPRRSTRGCPKEIDAILRRALAYDPEKRYPDARSFAEALVDVLFPTPHSAIQDLLGRQMQQVFADRVQRLRSARAHDPLIMKVLTNAAAQQAAYERISAAATPAPGALGAPTPRRSSRAGSRALGRSRRRAVAAPGAGTPPRTRAVPKSGASLGTAFLVGLLVAVGGAAGLHYARDLAAPRAWWSSPPIRPARTCMLDGTRTGHVTPAVLEGVQLSEPHEWRSRRGGEGVRPLAIRGRPGQLVAPRALGARRARSATMTVASGRPAPRCGSMARRAGTAPVTRARAAAGRAAPDRPRARRATRSTSSSSCRRRTARGSRAGCSARDRRGAG